MGDLLKLFKAGGASYSTRNIASAMRLAGFSNGTASNGTDTAHNSIKWFKNESGVTVDNITVVWPGWYTATDGNGSEVNNNGNLTITASLEYPAGTRTQILFGGSATGTVVAGTLLQADKLTLAGGTKIPAGAMAAIHTFITCSASVKWPLAPCANAFNGGTADNTENGASGSLTDKTMSGAPTGTGDGYFPCAILARVIGQKKVCLAACGDSITIGAGDSNYDTSNNTSWIGRAATGNAPILHMGVTGTTAQSNAGGGKFAKRVALMQLAGVTHCVLAYGTNDLAAARTPAQLQADYLSMAAQLTAVGIKVINYTILPRLTASSADKYETIGTQTVLGGAFAAGTGSDRHSYNTWVRGNPNGVFDYIETADLLDVNASNSLTSGGGYMRCGTGANNIDQAYSGTISAGATTTVMTTSVVKASNYFASFSNGYARFTSGANNGVLAAISSSNGSGQITLGAALASAPVAGDTITLQSARMAATNDGVHPNFTDNANSFGGHLVMKTPAAAKIAGWNA